MMFTQDNRFLKIDTPLGKDVLLLTGFQGVEEISRGFSFELSMVSEKHDIVFKDIIGKKVTVSIVLNGDEERYFNGIICRFSQGRGNAEKGGDNRFSYYTATMVPWSWLLGKTEDSRIFQEASVPDIITKILGEKGLLDFEFRLKKSYSPRIYCVQYRETDLDFISRILEEEGIYHFFEHNAKMHKLIFADDPVEHQPCPHQKEAVYQQTVGGWLDDDVITELDMHQEIRAGKYTLKDYNFEIPTTDLMVSVDAQVDLDAGEREVYLYPGEYGKRDEGDRLANLRMAAEETQITRIHGSSDCRGFTCGFRFLLLDHYREDMSDKNYVLTRVEHKANQSVGTAGLIAAEASDQLYANSFDCIPHDVPYVPPRITPKPVVEGVQTAIVVGPNEEEIYTDEHGRVKIQFHWDREGSWDEESSCWVRVSQLWAGNNWGAIYIPRVGQEVVVSFIEGDPDQPLITGRVYHGINKHPYPLPAEKTKSTIKSNSSPGGGGSNELRFEDKAGDEEVYLHAQRDWTIAVEYDKNQTTGNNETAKVEVNRSRTVGSDETIMIGANQIKNVGSDETLTIGSNRTKTVGADETGSIGGNSFETIGGNCTQSVSGKQLVSVGGNAQYEVAGSLVINAGQAIELTSPKITLNASTSLEIICGGTTIKLTPGSLKTESPAITTTAGATHDIKGAIVKHNC